MRWREAETVFIGKHKITPTRIMASSSRATGGDDNLVFLGGRDDQEALLLDAAGRGAAAAPENDEEEVNLSDSSSVQSADKHNDKQKDCACKQHYVSVNPADAKKVLFAMCLGLSAKVDPDDPMTASRELSEFNKEPYLSVKNKKPFRPMHKHLLLDEIERRFEVLKIPADQRFKRSNKIKASSTAAWKWLKDNPLTNPDDIAFLQEDEKNSLICK